MNLEFKNNLQKYVDMTLSFFESELKDYLLYSVVFKTFLLEYSDMSFMIIVSVAQTENDELHNNGLHILLYSTRTIVSLMSPLIK